MLKIINADIEGVLCDISIEGELITAVKASCAATEDCRTVDAAGAAVLPAMIDAHVHMRSPGLEHKEDWHSGSEAAVAGGVGFVVDTVEAKSEQAEELTRISGEVGDLVEVLISDRLPHLVDVLLDVGFHLPVVDADSPFVVESRSVRGGEDRKSVV